MLDQFLSGVSRKSIIRWTAIYLIIYAVINACGGLVLGLVGGLAAGVGAMTAASGVNEADLTAASASLTTVGGLSVILAIFYLISVPVFAIGAFGLFRRTSWARMGAVVALGFSILLSVLTLNNGISGIIWILISALGIYLFWTDEGIRRELEH